MEPEAVLREAPPLLVIDLRGPVTALASEPLGRAYRLACERGVQQLLLNFADVDRVNSAGIAVLIQLLTEARRANRQLLLTGLSPHHRKLFQLMGLSEYAPVFDTEEAARRSVTGA
jgi:anti-anti-sigma factor